MSPSAEPLRRRHFRWLKEDRELVRSNLQVLGADARTKRTNDEKIGTDSILAKPYKNGDEFQLGDGVKKAPSTQSFRRGHPIANTLTTTVASVAESCEGMIEAALKIARHRRETFDKIKEAFDRNDKVEVLRLTKELLRDQR